MADRQALLQQLQELKALRAQITEEDVAKEQPQASAPAGVMDTALSWDSTKKSLGNMASGIGDLASNAGWALRGAATDPFNTLHDASKLAFDPTFYAGVTEGIGGMIPGVTPLARFLADKVEGTDRSNAEYGQMVNQDMVNVGGALAGGAIGSAVKATPGIARGMATGIKDLAIGTPEATRLAARAPMQESFANTLNFPSRRTAVERQLTDNAAKYADEFTATNPTKGIDPSGGREAFTKFRNNLEQTKALAINDRQAVLKDIADRESTVISMGGDIGLAIDDINLSPLGELAKNVPGGELGVPAALNYLREKFAGRKLSVTELNDTRKALDNQIAVKGGWDPDYIAAQGLEPSAVNAEVSAMKYLAGEIDRKLNDYIVQVSGDKSLANTFSRSGKQIGMAKTYGEMAKRFQTETGESFIPGSAKQVPPGRGPLGSGGVVSQAADFFLPGRQRSAVQMQGLSRESQALSELQKLIDYRTGALATPAPRGWAQIKTSMQHLNMVSQVAMSLGMIASMEELANMPDEMARKIVTRVAQAAPEVFQKSAGGYRSEMDGRISSPVDQDLAYEAAKRLPTADRAKAMAGLYDDGILFTPTPKPETLKPSPLGDINSLLPDVMLNEGTDYSYAQPESDTLAQMRKSMGQHDIERSGL